MELPRGVVWLKNPRGRVWHSTMAFWDAEGTGVVVVADCAAEWLTTPEEVQEHARQDRAEPACKRCGEKDDRLRKEAEEQAKRPPLKTRGSFLDQLLGPP